MHYSSNCGCGCNYDCGCNTVPSTCCNTTNNITTTTTLPCVGELCDELYSADCILYKGLDIPCYGLKNNDTLTSIIDLIVSNLEGCVNATICFTINYNDTLNTESCLSFGLGDLWNGKPYYKIQVQSCSELIGYVYWNSIDVQWEFSDKLGGGIFIYATLPIPSYLPISTYPWIYNGSDFVILSSSGKVCNTTTSTTTSTSTTSTSTTTTIPPCDCYSLHYNAPEGHSGSVTSFTYIDCNGNRLSGSIADNTTKTLCLRSLVSYDVDNVRVGFTRPCSSNCTSTTSTTTIPLPPPTTSSTTSTTSTTSTSTTSTTTTRYVVDSRCMSATITPLPDSYVQYSYVDCCTGNPTGRLYVSYLDTAYIPCYRITTLSIASNNLGNTINLIGQCIDHPNFPCI